MKGRLGRVARQRSAKPCTAVRIRQAPQKPLLHVGVCLLRQISYYLLVLKLRIKRSLHTFGDVKIKLSRSRHK